MSAVQTNLNIGWLDDQKLKQIMSLIRSAIPVGTSHHKEEQEWDGFNNVPNIEIIQKEVKSASYQIGSLGGGNHFIELQKDENDFLWLMVHSGSRHFGFEIAKEYHKKARELCTKWYSNIPDKELSFIPLFDDLAQEYIEAMNYALNFALESRRKMIKSIQRCISDVMPMVSFNELININHNYAAVENHFGKNVVVHRKGATSAKLGEIGIIPGSQGTSSYIVKGLGNPESFNSCSHGAGRRLGRKQAIRELSLEDEVRKLDRQGIIHSIRNRNDLDEASGAYKDINIVMANQYDLFEIVETLKPIAVIKG